jgi:Protein of unknown function (DUF1553)/Protein of unknown function (DUF1549)/Concanavalin A-like lectin/glucanases superfamily/Planctomycete cytochrome C
MRTFAIVVLALAGVARGAENPAPVQFSRDILPILSAHCFQCHGPDEKARKAHLRLDVPEVLKARAKSDLAIVAPGKSAESEIIARVTSTDPSEIMPPPKSNRKLTGEQKELLRRWVDQGAVWGKHWAYETPVRPTLPAVRHVAWPRNIPDYFILARLEKEGLAPSDAASRETLVRRVTLDLTGLPPTLGEVQAFLADQSPNAYETVVDRLLASPRYGERMAMDWLDEARFADTNGFQNDFARTMWPWRDWVINAFNHNQSFDQFIIDQLAGDLLPGATLEQKVATGFNRNNRAVTEAGSIEEEWRVENAVDRVETTTTVFLGLTVGCARCHDHKFDPISQKDFYKFFGFFNSVNDKGVYTEQRGNTGPLVALPSPSDEQHIRELTAAIDALEKKVRAQEAGLAAAQKRWEKEQPDHQSKTPSDWSFACPLNGDSRFTLAGGKSGEANFSSRSRLAYSDGPAGKALKLDGKEDSFLDAGQSICLERTDHFSYGCWVRTSSDGAILSKMDDNAGYRGFDILLGAMKVNVHLVHTWPGNALKVETQQALPKDTWTHVFVTYDGSSKASGIKVYFNGHNVALDVREDRLKDSIGTTQPLRIGKRSSASALKGEFADLRIYPYTLSPEEVKALATEAIFGIVRTPEAKRSKVQQTILARFYRERHAPELVATKDRAAALRQKKAEFEKRIPTVMVMEELKSPRETFVLKRGRYELPDKDQKVQPGVPGCMPPMGETKQPNRLALARWLSEPANPLTARVTVNRFWQHYFGVGLVKTADNFGVQGELPSHPELLDWLATEFVRQGWDIKALQRLIVTSATYRQSSRATPDSIQRDPENRLLARGPRFRLQAESVRDNALAIGGLMVDRIGGQSIKPYQPAGLWEELAGGAGEAPYVQEKDANLYRRSLYIYRKRTVPPPSMTTFDAPSGEICQVKRARTNTPLQALELLNDVTFVEAARSLAQLMIKEGGNTPESRIAFGFRRATARVPTATELKLLARGLTRYRQVFDADPEAAKRLIKHGESAVDNTIDPKILAAYLATAGVILNLDETITKE